MARNSIFIAYRREDTADVAGRVYDALAHRFGRGQVFKDVDDIRPGVDFGEYIKAVLPKCRVALVLIGPAWLDACDEAGSRRLDDPHDWVRIEIETALAQPGLDVVPVLINGARMPRAIELPEALHPLVRRNAAVIRRDPDFRDDVDRLSKALRASVRSGVLDLANIGGDHRTAAPGKAGGGSRTATVFAVFGAAAVLAVGAWVVTHLPGRARETTASEGMPAVVSTEPAPAGVSGTRSSTTLPIPFIDPCDVPFDQRPVSCKHGLVSEPEMISLPGGTFMMGSPRNEPGRGSDEADETQHVVTVGAFEIAKYDVTFDGWDSCVADGGCDGYVPDDEGWGRGSRPVINVSWNDAQTYIAWLNEKTHKSYRLPTEAEWEYAARGGTTSAYYTGDTISTAQANFNNYYGLGHTQPVGAYPPNPYGLYDMAGNVWQWEEDCYHNSYSGAPTDGSAWTSGDCSARVVRGGSQGSSPLSLRAAHRFWFSPTFRGFVGFRLARTN